MVKKSAKVVKKNRAKVRKPTVPEDILAVITESFSGHEKLYDDVNKLWGEAHSRIYKCPSAIYMGYRMHQGVLKSMRNALSEGLERAKRRQRKKETNDMLKKYARPKPK